LKSLSLDFQDEGPWLQRGEGKSTLTISVPRSRLTGFFSSECNGCTGTTPPLLSVTIPDMEPVIVCPLAAALNTSIANITNKISSL
jgi:hypothetical protein